MSEPGTNATIAFIGLGRMGLPMALTLARAGYRISGSDVSPSARAELITAAPDGSATGHPVDAIGGADAVILMLPDSRIVNQVLFADGVLAALPVGTLLVDMSSSEPTDTRRIAAIAADSGIDYVDAPVSGGVTGAQNASLTIVVGGTDAAVARASPLLEVMGSRVLHVGPSGAGHAVKALNNLMSATHLLVTSEAMLVADKFGLDVARVLDAVNTSSGRSGSTENKWPNFILPGSFDSGFALRLMLKDMSTALGLAQSTGGFTPLSTVAVELWKQAAEDLPATADHTEIASWLRQKRDINTT